MDLNGEKRQLWYCIHCSYYGYNFGKRGEHEVCPECGWVVYSDEEVKEDFLPPSNIYPKLIEKYRKVHKVEK